MTFLSTRLERGSLAPSVAAIIVVLFLLGGLIIDGARALHGRSQATAYAEEGARIAGQGVTFDRGRLELDARAMRSNAVDYCTRIRAADDDVGDCGVEPVDGEIVFTVSLTVDKGILGMVTPDPTMTFVGTGRAIAEIGITEARSSADQPRAIESQLIPGDEVEADIREAPGGQCPDEHTWEDAPSDISPSPYEFWMERDYTFDKPASCPVPPVCPNQNEDDLLGVHNKYKNRRDEIDYDLLRQDEERWREEFERCVPDAHLPDAEGLLYKFTKPPKPTTSPTESPTGTPSDEESSPSPPPSTTAGSPTSGGGQ